MPNPKRTGIVVLSTKNGHHRLVIVHNRHQVEQLVADYAMDQRDRGRLVADATARLVGTDEPSIELPQGTFVCKFVQETRRFQWKGWLPVSFTPY